jgi:hypothetical protein
MDKNKLEKQAIGIVSQLFDLAEVPVEKRQQINDTAYDYMLEQLRLHSVVWQSEQLKTFNCVNVVDGHEICKKQCKWCSIAKGF